MQELTDAMISSDVGSFNMALLVFPLILAIIFLAVVIRLYMSTKKKPYIYAIIITIVVMVSLFIVMPILFDKGKDSDWYLVIDKIENKYTTTSVSDPGSTKTSYLVTVLNDDVFVSKDEYANVDIGEEIYVLMNAYDDPIDIYLMSEYEYMGDRLYE